MNEQELLFLIMINDIKNEEFKFMEKRQMLYNKMFNDKNFRPKQIYKFALDYFSIRRVVFVLIVKNYIKSKKFELMEKRLKKQ